MKKKITETPKTSTNKKSLAPERLLTTESSALSDMTSLKNKDFLFPIVGIGASAGGLAAFETFFSGSLNCDKNNKTLNMAFIIVQHLDPNHKSILAEIIKYYTKMSVFEVTDKMRVKSNCVYIIPPNYNLTLKNYILTLTVQSSPRSLRLPIDHFFTSMAASQGKRAIGVILSGTGKDGTMGARAIKSEGGIVLAQTLDSCEHDDMPRNIINSGLADYVLLDVPVFIDGR